MRTEATARDLYLQLADTHSCLAIDEQLCVEEASPARPLTAPALTKQNTHFRSFAARPVTAALAGLVVGLFGASMVFGYVVPRVKNEALRSMTVFTESFESETLIPQRGFPSRAGVWSGDLSGSLPAETGLQPKHGDRMVRLTPHERRKFSYAWRIVDLNDFPLPAGAESRQVEVMASFHGVHLGTTDRNQIRLAAFAEQPGDVKPIWNSENMFDHVLQHVGRSVTVNSNDQGWQTIRARMEIPAEARSLVISLAAAMADDSALKTAHYLDDVHVQFVIKEGTP
jgi:hypothetical protein